MYFGISYGDDIDKALEVLNHVAEAHPKVISYMPIWAGVQSLDDWAVSLRLRAWVATPDLIQVSADLKKSVKQSFDSSGITIPFPTTTEYRMEKPESAAPKTPKDPPLPPERDTSG